MPAYRSEAEAEIRVPVVERLREIIPGCRIIHEINAASFGNRIDVLAVGRDRIAAVEIKSSKDKLDRLEDQLTAMRGVAHHVFAAIHEKFLEDRPKINCVVPPEQCRRACAVWVYPRRERGGWSPGSEWEARARWVKPEVCLPANAIHALWRDELHAICRGLNVGAVSKLTMPEAIDLIRWHMTGAEITRAICAALRARECVEADAPIVPLASVEGASA